MIMDVYAWYALGASGFVFLMLFGVWSNKNWYNLLLKVLFLLLASVDLGLTVLHLQKVGIL